MGQSDEPAAKETGGPQEAAPQPPSEAPDQTGDDGEPTAPVPVRWTGSAAVSPPTARRRRWRLFDRETTEEFPDEEPWPPPPPPRPPDAPVTAPYPPPPQPPAWHPPRPPAGYPPMPWPQQPVVFYPPALRPRRRRWPWVLGTFVLITVLCCGCCLAWLRPYAEQYPATATLPAQAAGLAKRDDATAAATTTTLEAMVRSRYWLAEDTFAAVYAEPGTGRRQVIIFGTTLLLLDPEKDLRIRFTEMTGEMNLTDIRTVDAGPAGGHQRCADGQRDGEPVAVCGWADHGSIAIGIFSERTVEESAELLRQLRAEIITRG